MDNFDVARQVLSMPEGPPSREVQHMARAYLADLSKEEYNDLKEEALTNTEEVGSDELAEYQYKIFKQLCFTDIEASSYCKMRLNSPGIRCAIARRTVLVKKLGRDTRDFTYYDYARAEDSLGLTPLGFEELIAILGWRF